MVKTGLDIALTRVRHDSSCFILSGIGIDLVILPPGCVSPCQPGRLIGLGKAGPTQ